jgi:trimeric autotransporter adhesin
MFRTNVGMYGCLLLICCAIPIMAQQPTAGANGNGTIVVPPMITFSGVFTDVNGKPLTGVVGATFALYKDQQGGTPLWLETQNVYPDKAGHYMVMLGSTRSTGLPADIFMQGEARWLGVQPQGQPEQPRVLLMSVPYALKAADAQTVGGLPASAFVLAAPPATSQEPSGATPSLGAAASAVAPNVSGSGTADYIPLWTGTSTLANSVLYQSGTGSTAKVGINTTSPASTLDVKGGSTVRGLFSLPAKGTATATTGYNSQPFSLSASAFNSGTATAVSQNFRWQAQPAGNNTTSPSGTLNLLFGSGTTAPTGTGLIIASNGVITFASGQKFPGTGPGTITGVTAGTDLIGGGTSGNVTLNLDLTKVPQLNTPNTFTGNQTVNGNLAATGWVSGAGFEIGSDMFGWGSTASGNAFLGFAGKTTVTGSGNTAIGFHGLLSDTTGSRNTATGGGALQTNQTGNDNTATGYEALFLNTGGGNTASGSLALSANSTGSLNTASGYNALRNNTIGWGNTATGAGAMFINTTGVTNTAIGQEALRGNTASANTAAGYQALYSNDIGDSNTGIGETALYDNTSGKSNTATGQAALYDNQSGSWNAAGGAAALFGNTTGSDNTAFGGQALEWNKTGSNLTCIGFFCSVLDGLTNATAIGAYAEADESNALVLGCVAGVNSCPAAVSVGIGTTTPDNMLTVNGSADKPGGGSWGTYSDRRLKTLDGSFNSGLSQIMKLHPVRYRYNKENALGIQDEQEHVGLVAQDVQKVIPEAVTENNKGYLVLDNDPILWSMLNAIKEQQALIRQQQKQIRAQQARLKAQQAKSEAQEAQLASQLAQIKAQQTEGALQRAQIAELMLQVRAIQASLNTNSRTGAEVRTVKAEVSVVRQ